MKAENVNYRLLIRYLSGDCLDSEKSSVEAWIEKDPVNKQTLAEFKQIWQASAGTDATGRPWHQIDADWQALNEKISRYSVSDTKNGSAASLHVTSSKPAPIYQLIRVAAIFLVAALIGIFAYKQVSPVETSTDEPVLQEITTAMGQRVNLTLSDGTKVILNADSKMELPKVFEANKREVSLEGEAYFNVAKNPDKPFLIHTSGSTTRVLGTSFSISAYPEEYQIRVAVEEGRVSFETNTVVAAKQATLNGLEVARYNFKTEQLLTDSIDDLELYLGWTKGYLKFRKTAMRSVAKDMERRFGVDVVFEDPAIEAMLLTAHLKSRSIRNVLDVISMSLDLGYELQENRVTFYNR